MSALKQNVYCVKESHVGYSNLYDMTNSIIESPEVGVRLPEWQVTLHICKHVSHVSSLHYFHRTEGI